MRPVAHHTTVLARTLCEPAGHTTRRCPVHETMEHSGTTSQQVKAAPTPKSLRSIWSSAWKLAASVAPPSISRIPAGMCVIPRIRTGRSTTRVTPIFFVMNLRAHWALSLVAWTAVVVGLATPTEAHTQQQPPSPSISEVTHTPEGTATLFLRAIRAIRWGAAAQLLHDTTLERFHFTVTTIANGDQSGELGAYLVQTDSAGLAALDPTEIFDRAIGAVIDDMPGLMHALYDRDDDVIGSVDEDPESSHTVYRTTARISGAVPEVKVMQLAATPSGWRVVWSDELEVIQAALYGVGR